MYGAGDIYHSPATEEFGEDSDLAEIDAYLDEDDEEEEDDDASFGALLGIGRGGGVLGIAITDKAKRNKMARLLGKLKKYYEQGKLDKCRRYAKSLAKIDPIKKGEEGWITPEVQAWIDYAETGDTAALEESLSALEWSGDKDETPDDEVEGEVYTSDGGSSRPHRGRRRKLPPGFRPRGYSTWGPLRKHHWLKRHPNAASVRLPIDPGVRGPGPLRGHPGMRAAYRAGRASAAPAPVRHPFMRAAYRAGRASAPSASRPVVVSSAVRPMAPSSVARPTASVRPPVYSPGHPAMNAAYRAGSVSRPGLPGVRSAFRAGRASRYGLEEAIEEGVEDFGALIGADAFRPLQGLDMLEHDSLLEDDIDDDDVGDGVDLDDDDDDESMGAYIAGSGYGAYVPQFGAVFKKDIEDRLEGARRRYERLVRTTDMTDPDGEKKVMDAKAYYDRMVKAYAKASDQPEAPRKGPALRRAVESEDGEEGDKSSVSLFSHGDSDLEDEMEDMGISMGRPSGAGV